jgi:hypothetical protein
MFNILSVILFVITLAQNSRIWPVERQIVDSPVECTAGWDKDGNFAFERCGNDPARFDVTQSEGVAVWNGTFTHNHPYINNCWTFSAADLYWAAAVYVKEMRAVSKRDGVLRVAVARNTQVFRSISQETIDEEEARQMILFPDIESCAYLDATWRALSLRYNFNYEVITGD